MPAEFEQGFFVRVPAWHGLGVVLDDYPGREEAMKLAGHDWDVVEEPVFNHVPPMFDGGEGYYQQINGWKQHKRSDTGSLLHVSRDSYERIPNTVAYDFAELLLEQGFEYETGITLKGGALCALTLKLDEPIQITGDNSVTLPYLGLSWAHDGSAALKGRSTSVRQVCANTVAASEAEGAKLGTDFSIRHTKNWKARVEDAKKAVQGVREDIVTYVEVMEELATVNVTPQQRELFAEAMATNQSLKALDLFQRAAATGAASSRVQTNAADVKRMVLSVLNGSTVPEAHRFTAYGLHLAGVEYLDHLRDYQGKESYVGRTLLRNEPAKTRLRGLIREVVTV